MQNVFNFKNSCELIVNFEITLNLEIFMERKNDKETAQRVPTEVSVDWLLSLYYGNTIGIIRFTFSTVCYNRKLVIIWSALQHKL